MGSTSIIEKDLVSLEEFSPLDQDKCAICLGTIINRTELDSCVHFFCKNCISLWSKNKRICPLCNREFKALRMNFKENGTYEQLEVPIPSVQKPDIASDLECLDQTYFIAEAVRLLGIAQEYQRSMVRSQKQNAQTKFGNKFSNSWEARNWDSLEHIVFQLSELVKLLRSDEHIDPFDILRQLNDVQSQMEMIWRGPISCQRVESDSSNIQRYSADDYDDLSSDSEDEYTFEFEGSNPKKDRKVSGRTLKRPFSQNKKK